MKHHDTTHCPPIQAMQTEYTATINPSWYASMASCMSLLQVNLSVKLVQQLRDLAQRSGSSLFVTVLAAFKVLLLRYSNREDLVVGTPSSGRDRPELQENLVGCFVNLTMLRTSLAGGCCIPLNCIRHIPFAGA